MIADKLFELSAEQAITATAFSTNWVDMGSPIRDFGHGEPLYMVFQVTEAFATGSGTPLLVVNLVLDVDTSSHTFLTLLGSSVQHVTADLFAGNKIILPINPLSDAQRVTIKTFEGLALPYRYFGASYVVSGGAFNAGKITAFATHDPRTAIGPKYAPDAAD